MLQHKKVKALSWERMNVEEKHSLLQFFVTLHASAGLMSCSSEDVGAASIGNYTSKPAANNVMALAEMLILR